MVAAAWAGGASGGGSAAGGAAAGGGGFWSGLGGSMAAQGGIGWTNKLWNAKAADLAWQRQKKMFKMQTDWQKMMSDTAWQRGVADMRAAGINPLLAATQGGASTPSGGSSSAPQAAQEKGMDIMAMAQMAANIELTNAQRVTEGNRADLVLKQGQLLGPMAELMQLAEGFIKSFTDKDKPGNITDSTQTGAKGIKNMFDRVGEVITAPDNDTGREVQAFWKFLSEDRGIGQDWTPEWMEKWYWAQDEATQRRLWNEFKQRRKR